MRPSILISRENDVLRTTENKKYRSRGQKLPNLGSFFFKFQTVQELCDPRQDFLGRIVYTNTF